MVLEIKCDSCNGQGDVEYRYKSYVYRMTKEDNPRSKCLTCNGRGKVPTKEAKELLEFLKFHLADYFERYSEPRNID